MEIEEEEKGTDQPHLIPEGVKYYIIFQKRRGLSNKAVAREVLQEYQRNIHPTSIKRIWTKFLATSSIENDWSNIGRPRKVTEEDLERLEQAVQENRLNSCQELKNKLELEASRPTINRELINMGYRAYRAPQKPFLTEQNAEARLEFAESHQNWDAQDWRRVIFTDEARFSLINSDGRTFIRRRSEEAFTPGTIQYSTPINKGLMIWGAISNEGVGPLVRIEKTVTAEGYLDLFRYRLKRYYPNLYTGEQLFQDDNAPAHRATLVVDWFNQYNIARLDWPSRSPDLNIIEDIWSHLKYQMRNKIFTDEESLWQELQKEWKDVSVNLIERLYESLPRRITAVVEAEGKNTKY